MLAQVAPVLAPAYAGDIANLNALTQDIVNAGSRYGTSSAQLAVLLFLAFAAVGGAIYFNEYVSVNKTSHGFETGLFGTFQKLALPFVILLAVSGLMSQGGLMTLALWFNGRITGVVMTGPASILAMGLALGIRIVQQPLQVVLANIPPPDQLPLAPGILKNSIQAISLAQHSGILIVAGIATAIAFLVACFVWVTFAWITLEFIVATARISCVAPIRAFEMAWTAMPGTKHWGYDYYGYLRSAILQYIIICAVAIFIATTSGHWATFTVPPVGQPINLLSYLVSWAKEICGTVVCGGLAYRLPKLMTEGSGSPPATGARDLGGK